MSEFTDAFGDWLTVTVAVEAFEGSGFNGDEYSQAEAVGPVMVDNKRRMVRSGTGNEVLSEGALRGDVPLAGAFHPGDLVTLPSGRSATVISVVISEHELRFVEVNLT